MKAMVPIALALASPASAEVVSASSNGFEVRETVDVASSPAEAFAAFGRVGSWWDPEHSYSGSAANLRLDAEPGGCFCESLPNGGGVQHMRVTYVAPGKRIVLTGSLGPLLFLSTTGVMDVKFYAAANGTQITIDYRAAGFFNGGADKIAPAVDQVLSGQVNRLKAYLATTR
jgi:hypothetical protein